jgi:hypothetical protein
MGDGLAAACLGRKEPSVTTYVGKNFVFRRALGGLDSDFAPKRTPVQELATAKAKYRIFPLYCHPWIVTARSTTLGIGRDDVAFYGVVS